MNEQLQMFEVRLGLGGYRTVPAVNRDVVIIAAEATETSVKAAKRALPRSGSKRAQVFNYLATVPGATDEEIEQALNMAGNTVRPRRISLVHDQLVFDSGVRRKTRCGNDAIVWTTRQENPTWPLT
jgi:hypothetical protein